LKDQVKNYCESNKLYDLNGETGKISLKERAVRRLDVEKIPPEILDDCYTNTSYYLAFYEKL
jgi:hypothetical protein